METRFPKGAMKEQAYMTELYMEYERLMFVIAGRYAADPFEQEEIVQIALVRLWEKIDTLRQVSPHAVASYIAVTIRNTAINYRRKHSKETGRQVPLDTALEALPELQVLPADARLLAHENRAAVLRAYRSLPPEDQFLLEGKYILHCSNEALAEQLNCKPDSIRTKLFRVRKRFLALLQKEDPDRG